MERWLSLEFNHKVGFLSLILLYTFFSEAWQKFQKSYSRFGWELREGWKVSTVIENLFTSISNIRLEWCKLISSESEWVGDNDLGYTRVVKWCYNLVCKLQSMKGLNKLYVEPIIMIRHWYIKTYNNCINERDWEMKYWDWQQILSHLQH